MSRGVGLSSVGRGCLEGKGWGGRKGLKLRGKGKGGGGRGRGWFSYARDAVQLAPVLSQPSKLLQLDRLVFVLAGTDGTEALHQVAIAANDDVNEAIVPHGGPRLVLAALDAAQHQPD